MTTRIKDDEAPYVLARLAERLMEKEYILLIATMEEYNEDGLFTVKFTYRKPSKIGERQC